MVYLIHFGINATISIGREIQCLPYAGFFYKNSFLSIQYS